MLIAFDLLQLGLTPERAIGLLRSDGYVVVQAAGFCSRHLTRERTVDDKDDFYLAFDPTVLADLSNPGSSGELDDPVLRKVLCGASAYVLSEVGKGGRRWVILNLTHLIWEAAVRLELTGVTTIAAFADALLAWAASFDWRVADGIDPEA
ncbi:hypothetical protein [Sphingomonas guangdongensis]|uniref:hypothetical protein n=1 Tax=Sphingomonas guangdongensis TaxID=1141890 RepID=UPI000BE3792E|nr:hypothetical protein [Sphingomonas guangdongensis]